LKVLFWLPILVFFTCCPARAGANGDLGDWKISKEYRQGDCTLRVLLESETISSADDLKLRIEAEAPDDWRIEFLNFDPGDFTILEQTRSLAYRADSGRVTTRIDYRLEPFLPRDYRIPGARVSFIRESLAGEAAENPGTAELESEDFVVRVVPAAPDEFTPPGIVSAPADLPEQGRSLSTVFGAAALLVAAAGGFWLLRSRKARGRLPAVLSAREIAVEKIQSLLKSGLLDRKEFPLFFSKLSGVILSYTGHNGEAGGSGRPGREEAPVPDDSPKSTALKEFLRLSELIRFAGYEPSEGEVRRAMDCCTAILREEKQEPPCDASGAASISGSRPGV
jgi:hypothetical protein